MKSTFHFHASVSKLQARHNNYKKTSLKNIISGMSLAPGGKSIKKLRIQFCEKKRPDAHVFKNQSCSELEMRLYNMNMSNKGISGIAIGTNGVLANTRKRSKNSVLTLKTEKRS
jgi:hypothetical protein